MQQAIGEIAILGVLICSKPLGNGSGSNLGIWFFLAWVGLLECYFPGFSLGKRFLAYWTVFVPFSLGFREENVHFDGFS